MNAAAAVPPPPAGGARYHVWLFAPAEARDALAALLTIERELDDSARPSLDHGVAHARLEWWSEEVARLVTGTPRHPATQALARAADAAGIAAASRPALAPLVESARWRLAQVAFENRSELQLSFASWSRSLFAAACQLAVPVASRSPQLQASVDAFANEAGAAIREIESLLQAARLARLGQLPVPLDELATAGCGHEALAVAPWPPPLAALLRSRYVACSSTLGAAAAALPAPQRDAVRTGLIWAAAAAEQARAAVAALPNEYAPARFAPLQSTWTAWRAARACLRAELPAPLRMRSIDA
jgi:phytoene synthase